MNSECTRIADQLRRAIFGDAWHGPSLYEILEHVTAEQAAARPLPNAHTIWELVLHIETWMAQPLATITTGVPMRDVVGLAKEIDWPAVGKTDAAAWQEAKETVFNTAGELIGAIEIFRDQRLSDTVPGRDHSFYFLLHGVVQHTLYHAGQIAILKKTTGR